MTKEDKVRMAMQITNMDKSEALGLLTFCFTGMVCDAPNEKTVGYILDRFKNKVITNYNDFIKNKERIIDKTCVSCNTTYRMLPEDKRSKCITCALEEIKPITLGGMR